MATEKIKYPKYIYTDFISRYGKVSIKPYRGQFVYKNTIYYCGNFETVREAQIAVDKKRLGLGLEPLILKSRKKRIETVGIYNK